MPIIQENPTYFTDRAPDMDIKQVYYKQNGFIRNADTVDANISHCNNTRRRDLLSSEDTDELDVFLSSCESTNSSFTDNGMQPLAGRGRSSFGKIATHHGPSLVDPSDQRKGLSQKIGQFFWKSKSKHSVGSESHVSGSTIESSGRGSPRCTPDSSLSICTSSLEEGDSSHSSNSPNQISPKDRNLDRDNGNVTLVDDQTAFYRFDDCERYAANMYYNMMGEPSSYTFAVQQSRPRNNSVPVSQSRIGLITEVEDCVQPYYNNTTFSTFPNPRRHSIAYSSGSSSGTAKNKKKLQQQQVIEHDRDGYLRPNEPCNLKNAKNLCYINEPSYINSKRNGSLTTVDGKVQVHVDVHTPTSASSLSSTEFEALNSLSNNKRHRQQDLDLETTSGTIPSEDSQSTLVAGSACSTSYYQNEDCTGLEKNCSTSNDGRISNNKNITTRDKVLPMYMSRILSAGTDCEPYCTLCASTTMLASTSNKTRMDVAIVSCQECFFSKNAETHIHGFFDKLVTTDKQKMDVNLQSYDLKDLDRANVAADVHRSKVQIVIISHYFLKRLNLEASTRVRLSPVNRVFRSKRVIAVLVGVDSREIIDGYHAVLARFGEWFSVELRSTTKLDPEFCKKFTEQVVKIYNLELCNASNFSVFPKKVTREQPKIAMMFKKPIEEGDDIRIEFSSGRKTEGLTSLKLENPYTAIFRVPESLSPNKTALIEITVYVNNQKLGATWVKSELQTKNSDEDVIERMTKMVPGFLKLLDDHVSQTLSKNYRECTDFQTDCSIEIMNDVLICKQDEFPTIMHFAAYYGLEHTVWTLLDEADGLEQCIILNEQEDTPADLASSSGYENIVQIIGDYRELTNSWKALKYIQDLWGRTSACPPENLKIVSKGTKTNHEEITYQNDEAMLITEGGEEKDEGKSENDECEMNTDEGTPNSDGSYVTMPMLSNGDNYDEVSENKSMVVEDKLEVPKPATRSPKSKKDYVNVDPETEVVVENPEKVNLRKPRPGRDPKRRHSISPIQNMYDIPRPEVLDYSIPPPGTRPVFPQNQDLNAPVLKKKGPGPIPTMKDGYLIMEHDNTTASPSNEKNDESKSQIKLYNGDFIPLEALGKTDTVVDREIERLDEKSKSMFRSGSVSKQSNGLNYRKPSDEVNVALDPIDEELIQLMKEFPSNGYSIREIELLFENWKSRPDVMRSIDEKKKYMRDMREQYKRFQQVANSNSKKPSSFERIKGLITGRKKSSILSPISPVKMEHADLKTNNQFALQQEDIRKISQSRISDRGSFGSHESGGSIPDSGVSEPESEKEKEANSINNFKEKSSSSTKAQWVNPLDKRFCPPSYIGPDSSNSNNQNENKTDDDDENSYKTPPPPRPVFNVESDSPPLPSKPSMTISESPTRNSHKPPPPPKKPSHMRGHQDDSESPPPPPPRNYKPPNVFNYIDYSQKKRNPSNKSDTKGLRSPYDNVTEDK